MPSPSTEESILKHFNTVGWQLGFLASLPFTACWSGDSAGAGSNPSPPPPTVTLSAAPSGIPAGRPAILTWSSTNASTCTASDAWTGAQPTSGVLKVSPPAAGTYTYTLSCSSSGSSVATASATLTVTSASLAVTTATLPNGVIGTAYVRKIQATGGVTPFTWTVSSGALPRGLALGTSTSNTVTVSGMPNTFTQGGKFTIEVADSAQHIATQAYTVSVLSQTDSLVLSPAGLDFGNQLVGKKSSALTETLTNTATAPVALTGIAIAGRNAAEFSRITSCGASLAAGASCTIDVTFAPAKAGRRSAALSIIDNTLGNPHSVSLSGTGITGGPNATLSVTDLPFATQLVGTTSLPLQVKLTNYGTGALTVTHITATASFAETDNCIPGPAPKASCTISVTFTPGHSGKTTGTLSISDDALNSPQTVALSGYGSTNTPVLTGYCASTFPGCLPISGIPAGSQCPKGQPARHPIPANPCPGFIDMARVCVTGGSTRLGRGFCKAY